MNRLTQATATGNATYNQIYSYTLTDGSNGQYGNMSCTTGCTPANWSLDAGTNHLLPTSSYTYDAAGNLTKDSSGSTAHTYQWDAEGRVSAVDPANNPPTWSFTYNAVGDRVQWVSPSGTDQHIFDAAGTWLGVYGVYVLVRFAGRHLVVYTPSETYLNHINHLGSTTMMTNHAGTAVEDIVFYPWGQNTWKLWGTGGYPFADMPYYDVTTNTNYTTYRVYTQNLGRWHSPDPVAGDITNPQSLNRYAYVMNNPTTLVDPLGLQSQSGCIPGQNTPTCSAEEASQSNLGGPWQSLYGYGFGIANPNEFSLLFLSYDAPLYRGWSPLGDFSIPGPTYLWLLNGQAIGIVETMITFTSYLDYFYYSQYLMMTTPLESPSGVGMRRGAVIGPQRPPQPPPPPGERGLIYAGCVQNPDAYGATSNENSTGAIQGAGSAEFVHFKLCGF